MHLDQALYPQRPARPPQLSLPEGFGARNRKDEMAGFKENRRGGVPQPAVVGVQLWFDLKVDVGASGRG